MIARICIFILLFIVLPDVYIYARYVRRRTGITLWQRLLWWAPATILIAYTIALSLIPDFAPYELVWLNVYLFLLGLIAVPKLLFVFCSSVGLLLRRFLHIRRNWGNYVRSTFLFTAPPQGLINCTRAVSLSPSTTSLQPSTATASCSSAMSMWGR